MAKISRLQFLHRRRRRGKRIGRTGGLVGVSCRAVGAFAPTPECHFLLEKEDGPAIFAEGGYSLLAVEVTDVIEGIEGSCIAWGLAGALKFSQDGARTPSGALLAGV